MYESLHVKGPATARLIYIIYDYSTNLIDCLSYEIFYVPEKLCSSGFLLYNAFIFR